jgi:hypothetical protein
MKASFPLKPRVLFAGLLAAITGFSAVSAVLAEQPLNSSDQPLQVKLTTPLNAETSHYGDKFEGVLTEAYSIKDKALPEGTLFRGRVQRARKSLPFGMPGFVVLQIDEAQLPSGVVHHFESAGSAPQSSRVMNPTANTRAKIFKGAMPYTIISTATSVPLKYAAGFSSWTILPIALGSRIALGVAMQMKNKNKQNLVQNPTNAFPVHSTVGKGILEGSGLNTAYYFLSTSPEPVLSEGAVVPLHFRSQDLADLLDTDTKAQALPQAPAQTQEAVSQPEEAALPVDNVTPHVIPSGK